MPEGRCAGQVLPEFFQRILMHVTWITRGTEECSIDGSIGLILDLDSKQVDHLR